MISNPVNSTVPIAVEGFKKTGTYDEKKLFGVTTLDVVRVKTFYAGKAKVPWRKLSTAKVNVPVVGGHAGITILPLFSQVFSPSQCCFSVRFVYTSFCLIYAGAVFADACLKGLNGVPDIVECFFVQSSITELPLPPSFSSFFVCVTTNSTVAAKDLQCLVMSRGMSLVRLGKNGVEEVLGLGSLSDYEKQGLESQG
ncbi:malate dehydrogenase 1, mitochondrial-like [Elaeis guineensis]|uniref:malate dehydrogenase 1, mitochondrial-like n=1 Tax=Elaeis guineensis var. tenera TaxID=51953 RepID=UPI003C6CD0A9